MVASETTCGVVIYDKRRKVFRSCGLKGRDTLIINGDHLFSICARHARRVDAAIAPRPHAQTCPVRQRDQRRALSA